MNKPLATNQLKMQLYCRDIAIRLAAESLVDFFNDVDSTDPVPWLWCGGGYLSGVLEPFESWQQVDWLFMPLLADLYNAFGESGLYVWCAWQRNSPREYLQPAVQQVYDRVMNFIRRYQIATIDQH